MRITGGIYAGRSIAAPVGQTTRPTSDRVREALFNILAHRDWGNEIGDAIENAVVLDAFCGTGALALDAISRGAKSAILFDTDKQAQKQARENIAALSLAEQCQLMPVDATQPPRASAPCSLIFLDPPYRKNLVPLSLTALHGKGWIAPRALIVAETAKKEALKLPEGFVEIHDRVYGDTAIHFLTLAPVE